MDHFQEIDLSSSLRPILLPDETRIILQDQVGLYDGNQKAENYQEGVVYLTSHRVLYVDSAKPRKYSVGLGLHLVKSVESYGGFLKSSPKLILHLYPKTDIMPPYSPSGSWVTLPSSTPSNTNLMTSPSTIWICPICSYSNLGTLLKCKLCGVKKPETLTSIPVTTIQSTAPPPIQPPSLEDQISTGKACPACTFVNHPSMISCEMCSTELGVRGGAITVDTAIVEDEIVEISSLGIGSSAEEKPDFVKLSFRNGGQSNFLAALKNALIVKAWEKPASSTSSPDITKPPQEFSPSSAGINGIANSLKQSQTATDVTLSEAFKDLDGLMANASQMVKLAEQINAKLIKEQAEVGGDQTSEDETMSFRTYLLNLGIASPVTKDSAGAIYHKELARELAETLSTFLDREGGMKALTDIYCIFNRARGNALISPEDLYKACSLFEELHLPMRLRKFDSGLLVVQSLNHSDDRTAKRILEHVLKAGPMTAIKIAELENVTLSLATEQLLVAEKQGLVCRDESVQGLTFYENILRDYQWDLST